MLRESPISVQVSVQGLFTLAGPVAAWLPNHHIVLIFGLPYSVFRTLPVFVHSHTITLLLHAPPLVVRQQLTSCCPWETLHCLFP